MQTRFQRIAPFLWFDDQAEEAARFYASIFDDSRIVATTHYGKEAPNPAGRPPGSVMTVAFELDGQAFTALNGGPEFKFNEAVSLVVNCRDQAEIDRYWDRLSEGGDPEAHVCGWLKDRYGVSWQVVPAELTDLIGGEDEARAARVMAAVMQMKKLDLAILRKAADG